MWLLSACIRETPQFITTPTDPQSVRPTVCHQTITAQQKHSVAANKEFNMPICSKHMLQKVNIYIVRTIISTKNGILGSMYSLCPNRFGFEWIHKNNGQFGKTNYNQLVKNNDFCIFTNIILVTFHQKCVLNVLHLYELTSKISKLIQMNVITDLHWQLQHVSYYIHLTLIFCSIQFG